MNEDPIPAAVNFDQNSESAVISPSQSEYHLKVYSDRSELVTGDGSEILFIEGPNNAITKSRYRNISTALSNGFLKDQIRMCREEPQNLRSSDLADIHQQLIDALVDSMTSEVGRALIGLAVLQLTVKVIEPLQSIRLHKGGNSSRTFGWRDGISMRSIDAKYITPCLRDQELVKLNSDGFMMTRTLAENYPYTRVYKAAMRGARVEWLSLVEGLEMGEIQALPALQYLLSKLLNNAAKFEALSSETLDVLDRLIAAGRFSVPSEVILLLKKHMIVSSYAPRIMEIAMHALMQALQEIGALGSANVIRLSQMRSANKKHGNIGDVELMDGGKIIESWDAKYGKTYLRDELEELNDKLETHDAVMEAGFVTSEQPLRLTELSERIAEVEELNGVIIRIFSFEEWVSIQVARAEEVDGETDIAKQWIKAYSESLAQKRPLQAPIDEPCYKWLETLRDLLFGEIDAVGAS